MADNEGGEENVSRGNEWEVVLLTASTYAAAPGPKEVELKDENKGNAYGEDEAEISRALFMSSHFVFPPSQHENLPLEPVNSETLDEQVGKNIASELYVQQEGDKSGGKDEQNWPLKGFNASEELPEMQIFYEKGNSLSISRTEFEGPTTLEGVKLNEKEQSIYSAASFNSLHSDGLGGSVTYGENLGIPKVNEHSEQGSDLCADIFYSPRPGKDGKNYGSDLPCEVWWKRRAASLYGHARETNAFWPIFVAAAVMGLVILGQCWQQERWRSFQFKWQTSLNEKSGRILGPLSRLKDVIVGGHRRRVFISRSSSTEN